MNEAGQVLMHVYVLRLLEWGLRPNLARPISGIRAGKLKALARDVHGTDVVIPPGPAPSGLTRMQNLAGIFHASLFMECVEKITPFRQYLEEYPGRAEVTIFIHAWKFYRARIERVRVPYYHGAFTINEAAALYQNRGKLHAEACGNCKTRMYRLESGKGPVACPMCWHARRCGVDLSKGNLFLQLVERRRELRLAGKLGKPKPRIGLEFEEDLPEHEARTLTVGPPKVMLDWFGTTISLPEAANDLFSATSDRQGDGVSDAGFDPTPRGDEKASPTGPEDDAALYELVAKLFGLSDTTPEQPLAAKLPLVSTAAAGMSWPPAAAVPIALRPPYARERGATPRAWWTGPAWPWPTGAPSSVSPSPRARVGPGVGQRAASPHPSSTSICKGRVRLRAVGPPSRCAARIQRRMDYVYGTGPPHARAICPAVGPPPRARRVGRMATADPPHWQGRSPRGPPCPEHDLKAFRRAS